MKSYRSLFIGLVVLLSGLAFLPLAIPTLADAFHWQQYASSYQYRQDCYSLYVGTYPNGWGIIETTPQRNCPTDPTKYKAGTFIQLNAVPMPPHLWMWWDSTYGRIGPYPTNFNIQRNMSFIARFSDCIALDVTVSPPGSGTVIKDPPPNCPTDATRYLPGTMVQVTAKPNAGYRFLQWTSPAYTQPVRSNPNPVWIQLGDWKINLLLVNNQPISLPFIRR